MKHAISFALFATTIMISAAANASPHLTPAECHDYPFVPQAHPITHRQTIEELNELEAVGYDPGYIDYAYPSKLQTAEAALHQEYERDCLPHRSGS